jgi:hypothetical protein
LIEAHLNRQRFQDLVLHKDTDAEEGGGDVILNIVLTGGAYIVLEIPDPDGCSSKDNSIFTYVGSGGLYLLQGYSRNACRHGVVSTTTRPDEQFLPPVPDIGPRCVNPPFNPDYDRISMTLRFWDQYEDK